MWEVSVASGCLIQRQRNVALEDQSQNWQGFIYRPQSRADPHKNWQASARTSENWGVSQYATRVSLLQLWLKKIPSWNQEGNCKSTYEPVLLHLAFDLKHTQRGKILTEVICMLSGDIVHFSCDPRVKTGWYRLINLVCVVWLNQSKLRLEG